MPPALSSPPARLGPCTHRGVDQAVAVVHSAPRGDANGDDLTFVVAAAQAEVMHGLTHLLHHAGVGPPGDDPSSWGDGQGAEAPRAGMTPATRTPATWGLGACAAQARFHRATTQELPNPRSTVTHKSLREATPDCPPVAAAGAQEPT